MLPDRSGDPASRGFSLIELLVVIAIIALLIGILLPALGAAKRHAQTIECASRLRQLVIAVEIYADENDGFYPPRNGGDPGLPIAMAETGPSATSSEILLPPLGKARPRLWPVAVSSNLRQLVIRTEIYAGDTEDFIPTFVCPSDPQPTPPMSSTERFISWSTSFVFNGFNDFKHDRATFWSESDTTAMRRDEIRLPSAVGLFGEKKSGPEAAKLHVDIYGRNDFHPLAILDETRHQGGFSNVAFADGSTRTFAPPGTLAPENLWAVRDSNRYGQTPREGGE